jgi:hypothetical protein
MQTLYATTSCCKAKRPEIKTTIGQQTTLFVDFSKHPKYKKGHQAGALVEAKYNTGQLIELFWTEVPGGVELQHTFKATATLIVRLNFKHKIRKGKTFGISQRIMIIPISKNGF